MKPQCFAVRRASNDDGSTGERVRGDKPFPAIIWADIDGGYE
jgi:hypothetical protein